MDSKKIGRFIASQRKQLSMTQQELAEKLSMTNKTISKWETGEGFPDISVLPALAEIMGVTVDELLKGEKSAAPSFDSRYRVKETAEQAGYILESGKRHFSNRYLASLGAMMLGIIASSMSLRLYAGVFLGSLSYTLMISLAFLILGFMFYRNVCRHLKETIEKYNRMLDDMKADYRAFIFRKHVLFYAVYLIQVIICIGIIPLYPFLNIGFYRVFHTIFGNSSGRFTIDFYFGLALCFAAYCILFIAGTVIIRRSCHPRKP